MKKTLALLILAAAAAACHAKEKAVAPGAGAKATTSSKPSSAAPSVKPVEPSEPRTAVGDPMPPYHAATLDGGTFDIEKERGTVVLLNLWATWCGPCRAEMPELVKLHAKYAAKGFKVVGVSLDDASVDTVREFVKTQKIDYPIALDPDGKLANLFQASVIPTTVLVDRQGKIVHRQIGQIPEHDPKLAAAIESAIAGK